MRFMEIDKKYKFSSSMVRRAKKEVRAQREMRKNAGRMSRIELLKEDIETSNKRIAELEKIVKR